MRAGPRRRPRRVPRAGRGRAPKPSFALPGSPRVFLPDWPENNSFAYPGHTVLRAPQTFSTSWCGLDTLAADNAFLLLFVEEDAVRCESSHIAASGRDGPVLSLGVESGEEVLDSVCAVFTAGTVSAPS